MADPTFLTYPSFDDPRTQIPILRMLGLLGSTPDIPSAVAVFDGFKAPPYIWRSFDKTSTTVYALFFKWDNATLMLFGGMPDSTPIQGMIDGWFAYPPPQNHFGISDAFWSATNAAWIEANTYGFLSVSRFYICGHSFGGAMAQALAVRINQDQPNANILVSSFGSPRPGTLNFSDNAERIQMTRWFTTQDPVPHIPPHTNESPFLHAFMTNAQQLGCNAQVCAPLGKEMKSDGTVENKEISSFAFNYFAASMYAWIAGGSGFGSNQHSAATYLARMQAYLSSGTFQINRTRATDVDEPEVGTLRARNQIVHSALSAAATAETPVPGPTQIQYIVPKPETRYRIGKGHGSWFVTYAGVPYWITSTKRNAKHVARVWNGTRPKGPNDPPPPTTIPPVVF